MKLFAFVFVFPPSPSHPSGSSQCTSPKHPVSCIEPRLVIRFLYYIIRVSVTFSQIIPPSSSCTESKILFYTSVSLLLSRIQGYICHFSKFHTYALVYCIGVFLSGLLHSVFLLAPVSSISSELIQMNSFLRLSNTPLCICTTALLSIHLLMDI